MSDFAKKKKRTWKDQNHYERHYCELCNSWMGSDRASILSHEKGAKHQKNLQQREVSKRKQAEVDEQNQKELETSLLLMESAATSTLYKDLHLFKDRVPGRPTPAFLPTTTTSARPSSLLAPPATATPPQQREPTLAEYKAQKQERKRQKVAKRLQQEQDEQAAQLERPTNLRDTDGWYTLEDNNNTTTIYLEGILFQELLEPDLPVQYWLGSERATDMERKLPQYHSFWKDALVCHVRHVPSAQTYADRRVVDVAYLSSTNDNEETVVPSVPLHQIRIALGSDPRLPTTVADAHLLVTGGETVQVAPTATKTPVKVDEATGLSSWSTVSITRTSHMQQSRMEREREASERKRSRQVSKELQQQAQARQLEVTKHLNADDSALGAYDVWNQQKGNGYKGVQLGSCETVQVQEIAKPLSTDGVAAFKKRKKKKGNRRTTSADDD